MYIATKVIPFQDKLFKTAFGGYNGLKSRIFITPGQQPGETKNIIPAWKAGLSLLLLIGNKGDQYLASQAIEKLFCSTTGR